MKEILLLLGIILICMATGTEGGYGSKRYCIRKTGDTYYRMKCKYGETCCGPLNRRKCSYFCTSSSHREHGYTDPVKKSKTLVIVGIVLGVTAFIAIVVGIVICVVCFLRSSRRSGGGARTTRAAGEGSVNPGYKNNMDESPPPYTVGTYPMDLYPPTKAQAPATERKI